MSAVALFAPTPEHRRGTITAGPRQAILPGLILLWLLAACSTTYQPKHTGRVALGIHHAAAVYVKDGQAKAVGPFSGELPGLVAETPAAAVQAHRANRQFQIGIPFYLTGVGGVLVGAIVLSGPVGWLVLGGAVSVLATGLGFMGAGLTNAIDAVNIHNDAISEARPASRS